MNIGFTPVNQVRLTNVAYVRLQKKGKRFEIACYRNKVLNWRNKIETNIGEVLQIDTVFTNVSKGMLASSKDLVDAFGTADQKLVCQEILDKGELQVSEQERGALYESVFRDVASIVADKTVNPETNRPYTISMIQNAMKQIQYSISMSKNSKSQALDVIRKLRDIMPIVRANMLLRLVCSSTEELDSIRPEVVALGAVVVAESGAPSASSSGVVDSTSGTQAQSSFLDIRVDPESFRRVEEIVSEKTAGCGRVEVVQLRVANFQGSSGAAVASVQPDSEEEAEEKDQPKQKSSSSNSKRELKSRQRDSRMEELILQSMDAAEVDEELAGSYEEEPIAAIGMIVKNSKKKNKGKKLGKIVLPVEESESGGSESDQDDDLQLALSLSASMSIASNEAAKPSSAVSDLAAAGGGAANKKGKKSRRIEKEELREREQKAAALKLRVQQQQLQQQLQQQVQNESNTASREDSNPVEASQKQSSEPQQSTGAVGGKVQSCNTCGGEFAEVKDYRNHFRSEWHRHNLSRKMKGLPLVTSEQEFLSLSLEQLDL